jgi:cysteine desulfuration protein SufE
MVYNWFPCGTGWLKRGPPPNEDKHVMTIDQIIEDLEFLDDWEDRYRHIIDLGKGLEPLPETEHTEANKVRGCASQVWLDTRVSRIGPDTEPVLHFRADSDAHIVKGLIRIILAIYGDRGAKEILGTDAGAIFKRIGLDQHLTPQRSNGVRSMVERIKTDAAKALAPAEGPA